MLAFTEDIANAKSLIDFPSIKVDEVWGESPLFKKRCWVVYWPLSSLQVEFINQLIVTPDFWNSVQLLVPSLKIPPSLLDEVEAHEYSGSCSLEAIFCLAKSILSPTSLNICLSKYKIRLNGLHCAFESNQHEIAGEVINFTVNLIWECFSKLSKGIAFESSQGLAKKLTYLVYIVNICCCHSLTEALLAEAVKRQIFFCLLDKNDRTYHFGMGVCGRICRSSSNDFDSHIGVMAAQNKAKSHSLLVNLGFSVPDQIRFNADIPDESIKQIARKIGFPCVVKPSDTDRGKGVTANICNYEELKAAIDFAKKSTRQPALLLQKHVEGADFRLNITGGRLEFVVKRSAPVIIGNGIDTVKVCIEKLNLVRRSMKAHDNLSIEIDPYDKEVIKCLTSAGLSAESVIDSGLIVPLRKNSNVSTGGLREDIKLEDVHPRIVNQCLSIAKTLRLDSCGVDYITTDISLDPFFHPGAFIEVNSMPQQQPARACSLVQNLFPPGTASTIPCTLLLANWEQDSTQIAVRELQSLINKHPSATIACPTVLRSEVFSCLDDRIRIHLFSHPKELLINKSNVELICLMTPSLLLQNGWIMPRSQVTIVSLVKPSLSLASKPLLSYLENK